MQIWIHDKSMRKVCALNNEIPGMLPYTNSQWHPYLEYSTSTFDFTIPKIVNRKLHDDIKYINDQMFVSFYFDNSYHVFYVSKLVENDFSFQVTCNNTNLELAMEVARPLADIGGPKTIEWYLQNLELLGFAGLEIGVNEISDRTRTLTFESQSGTKLEQLHSLMNQFDAEFIFRTELNRDGTMKRFIIDIYQEADENHHGIGKARGDVVLYYQSGLKGVQVTSDKTQLFNAGNFIGQDGVNLNDVEFEEKNELGQVEFYSRKGTSFVFAPLSRERYPSTMNPDSADNWTRKDFQTEYKDVESLKAYALRTIKQYAYPLLTYTVDVQSSFLDNYKDINLGDTVKIIDNNFRGGLALEARVSEMIISFDNPTNNSVVFTNFRKLDNKPSSELQQRIDEIVSKSLPYHVEIRTTNGTVFKNGIGRSTVKPILKQGDKIVDATYRFVIDGTIKYVGMTYDMVASEINQPTTLTISAWVDNKEVASEEVTFVNVSDGKQGPKGPQGPPGPKGDDGKTPYVHFAYADSADGQKGFSLTQTGSKRYLGVLTNFIKEDSTNPADYTWSDAAGSISVGGRNLLVKTNQGITNWDWTMSNGDKSVEEVNIDGIRAVKLTKGTKTANTGWNYIQYRGLLRKLIRPNTKYTLSFDVKPSVDVSFSATLMRGNRKAELTDTVLMNKALANQWTKVSCVLTSKETLSGDLNQVVYLAGMPTTNGNWVIIKNIKLEEGDIPTQWTPAIEDIQDEIDSKADDVLTQAQLNRLNETNSIIKAELNAKASLDTLNQWVEAYQNFVNANNANRAQAEKDLADASARVTKLENDLNDMSERWNFIDSYMAASNEGLVIGKKDESSSIMFNPNGRISMFSAGNEVMYISKGVIHIENGIFSKTIQIGRYREEQDLLNPDRNVIRYVGGA
ncbi:antireceptor [Streptococcus phage P7601]|uniref:Antireceptor n=1 Tax=Streptococcus phage P7601 TaxID=1971431 RepID=A0A286QPV8_9CAUD|nr:antireceptor [Streptococcus phage P7601]ARU13960.1 antireceptor [Streptococcus phage P7601]